MPNPVFDAVRTVLAVREYQDKGVADDVVRRVAEAGRLTASGQNRQPWHFVIVRDRTVLQRLGKQVRTGPYVAGSAAFEIATRARQAGVPAYAVTGENALGAFDARMLDLQLVLEARGPRGLAAAGRRLASLA